MVDIEDLRELGYSVSELLGEEEADLIFSAIDDINKHRKFSNTMLQISWHGQDADEIE